MMIAFWKIFFQVYRKLLVGSVILSFWVPSLGGTLTSLNVIIRTGREELLSSAMRFEIHPLAIFCQTLWGCTTIMACFHWFLGFAWKNKIIRGRETIFGVKFRTVMHLNFVFLTLVCNKLNPKKEYLGET